MHILYPLYHLDSYKIYSYLESWIYPFFCFHPGCQTLMHPAVGYRCRDFEKAGLSDSIFSCQFVSWLLVSICFYYGFLGVSMLTLRCVGKKSSKIVRLQSSNRLEHFFVAAVFGLESWAQDKTVNRDPAPRVVRIHGGRALGRSCLPT